MKKIAVYGSLKKGFYNYRENMGEPIGHSKVRGTMYLCHSYPHLYRYHEGDEGVRLHDIELYEISDDLYDGIVSMEVGAGYEPIEEEFVSEDDCTIHMATIFYTRDDRDYKRNWIEEYSAKTVPFAMA